MDSDLPLWGFPACNVTENAIPASSPSPIIIRIWHVLDNLRGEWPRLPGLKAGV